jgi:hypothetical protein
MKEETTLIEETDGLVIAEKVDHLAPIKETVGQVGIEMPDMVATGDLHVDYKVKDDEQTKDVDQKKIPLPEMGTKFMLWGNEYKVIYINEGKHRFSCEPCKGVY